MDVHPPHPIGVHAPGRILGVGRGILEEERQIGVGGGVEVARDLVAGVEEAHFVEHLGLVVPGATAVLGVIVEVESVVGGLHELPVAQNLLAQGQV